MLIADYIKSKLSKFNITLDDNELEGLLLKNSIAPDEVYEASNTQKADIALHSYIPELLALPDISEGGFSIKFDRQGILAYYKILCSDLGLEDKTISKQPKIRNMSRRLW
ncbi:DUF6706 family protein [Emticicia sp. BO119]|uniref:DUF6706 family protein n=1 Tax=Emticicia sp. BO119 TaxID=2757768 RepID=UPI0015F05447|nr:DUF6706 family protein [Emticicia sp. BO119]MBA4852074.1 hypothetical protein [Emticicia sp. BO119]